MTSRRRIIVLVAIAAATLTAWASNAESQAPGGNAPVITANGFDKCGGMSAANMQTWWGTSPLWAAGAYVGGAFSGGCPVTASWISAVTGQGWDTIPIWLGLQSQCFGTGTQSRISTNTTTAYNQGVSEAQSARSAASARGYSAPSIIYVDLEAYTGTSACRASAQNFIGGWSAGMANAGWKSGGYGSSCQSYVSDWVSAPPGNLWGAWFNVQPNTDLSCVAPGNWYDHQRIKQWDGTYQGHSPSASYGGLNEVIDFDCVDGRVAGLTGIGNGCTYFGVH